MNKVLDRIIFFMSGKNNKLNNHLREREWVLGTIYK